jgi:hypothetical protein
VMFVSKKFPWHLGKCSCRWYSGRLVSSWFEGLSREIFELPFKKIVFYGLKRKPVLSKAIGTAPDSETNRSNQRTRE